MLSAISFTSPKAIRHASTIFAATFVIVSLYSCMAVKHLKSEQTTPSEVQGTFTLMLYGCRYPDDVENVAILDKDGDPYTFEIYAPDFRYKVKTGLAAEEALKQAEQFIRCSVHYQQSELRKILDPTGNIIGYEVRPLYSPIRFGRYDLLDIQYTIKDNKIIVYVKLDPTIEKELLNEGGRDERDSK
jgi:hypothetical protein